MTKDIIVPALARVEGEGALYIRTKDGVIDDIELNIYEPPRFFEGFLLGRHYQEVPDITARICGICPVAYQMSSAKALEMAYGVKISPELRTLRRLLYCAEYVESHALHIYMLQIPDLLGKESVIEVDYEFVALTQPDEYAIYDGEILSSTGRKVSVEEYESVYLESHVAHSTALHSHTVDGNPYFVGPLARLNVNFEKLHPIAHKAAEDIGLEMPLKNPYKNLIARAIELVEVCDVAIELIEAYDPQGPAYTEVELKDGEGNGVSEAPRGIL